jgi:hypothetical protein
VKGGSGVGFWRHRADVRLERLTRARGGLVARNDLQLQSLRFPANVFVEPRGYSGGRAPVLPARGNFLGHRYRGGRSPVLPARGNSLNTGRAPAGPASTKFLSEGIQGGARRVPGPTRVFLKRRIQRCRSRTRWYLRCPRDVVIHRMTLMTLDLVRPRVTKEESSCSSHMRHGRTTLMPINPRPEVLRMGMKPRVSRA